MLMSLKNKILNLLKIDHERTLNIKKNIVYSFLIRGLSSLTGFLLVPLTIHYLNTVQYGIWLTIASLVAWINTFDIGLSNGLRNKLAESFALNKKENIAKYISTTYALLFIIALAIFIIFFSIGTFFNWDQLLRMPSSVGYSIRPIILIATGFFCIQFVLQPINSILIATQQPFKSSLILLAGQFITLIATYVLIKSTSSNLLILVIAVSGAPIFALLLASLYFFITSFKSFIPKLKFIDFKSAKNLLSLSTAFFFVQIGALVLYETDNIIITRTLGPSEVTTFNIAYKYFSILTIAFNIIITPYWSAYTDAYAKNDFAWIKHSIKKLRIFWVYFSIAALVLYFFSGVFYKFWVGDKIAVPGTLSLSVAIYVMVQNWYVLHNYLLNGTGKLRVQLILITSMGIVNILLSVLLINYIGIAGTVIANIIVMAIMTAFLTYQSKLVMNRTATGIWNK